MTRDATLVPTFSGRIVALMDPKEEGRILGQEAQESGQRAHMREMTAARQAAERARGMRSGDPALRRAREEAYKAEMTRIAEEHQAWLQRWASQGGR